MSDDESGPSESSFVSSRRRAIKCFGCGGYSHKRVDCFEGRSNEQAPEKKSKIRSGKFGGANATNENEIAFGVARCPC